MSYTAGQHIGSYEIVETIDNPRHGVCYRVWNPDANRHELLRVLPETTNSDEKDRFLREILVHSRLSHPNLVSFCRAGDVDGHLVMTTEWLEGISLEEKLHGGLLPVATAIDYGRQALAALGYAHQHGIVHREIAPANLIITAEGTVKLTGFGLAKSSSDAQLTRVGTVMGWIEYMSPEQVQGSPNIDRRSDLYSMGAVLYEMVTGRPPFMADSQFEVMAAHVRAAPAVPSDVNPEVPTELSSAILVALEKNPEKRYPTAEAFRQSLENVSASLAGVPPSDPALTEDNPPPRVAAEPAAAVDDGAIVVPERPLTLVHMVTAGVFAFLVVMLFWFAATRLGRG